MIPCANGVSCSTFRHATLLPLAILGSEPTVSTERRGEEKKGSLTAVRISSVIVVHAYGATVKLAFRWDIRNATLNA